MTYWYLDVFGTCLRCCPVAQGAQSQQPSVSIHSTVNPPGLSAVSDRRFTNPRGSPRPNKSAGHEPLQRRDAMQRRERGRSTSARRSPKGTRPSSGMGQCHPKQGEDFNLWDVHHGSPKYRVLLTHSARYIAVHSGSSLVVRYDSD